MTDDVRNLVRAVRYGILTRAAALAKDYLTDQERAKLARALDDEEEE